MKSKGKNVSAMCKTLFGVFLLALVLVFGVRHHAFSAEPLSLRDDTGRVVVLAHPAVRIVSLNDAHTENIVALRAVRQLVGVSDTASYVWAPKSIKRLPLVPKPEDIAVLRPDLVILEKEWSIRNQSMLSALSLKKIDYIVINSPKWTKLKGYLEKLGAAAGRSKEAEQTLVLAEKHLNRAVISVSGLSKLRSQKVFVVASSDFSTCASDSWGAWMIRSVGANILTDKDAKTSGGSFEYIPYGAGKLIENGRDVDIIITLKGDRDDVPFVTVDKIKRDKRFQAIPAVANGKIFEMKESDLMLPSMARHSKSLSDIVKILKGKKNKILDSGAGEFIQKFLT